MKKHLGLLAGRSDVRRFSYYGGQGDAQRGGRTLARSLRATARTKSFPAPKFSQKDRSAVRRFSYYGRPPLKKSGRRPGVLAPVSRFPPA